MTAAERRALVMLARDPDGLYADPSLLEWCVVLEGLRIKGCASIGTYGGGVTLVYRLTPAGILTLHTEATALEKQAAYALGKAHHTELTQEKLGYDDELKLCNPPTWIAVYDRLATEARELHLAHESVGWGEYGPYKKEKP